MQPNFIPLIDPVKDFVFNIDHNCIFDDLIQKGWSEVQNFIPISICDEVVKYIQDNNVHFKQAAIGKGLERSLEQSIRDSRTLWIEEWESNSSLRWIHKMLQEMMIMANQSFFLSMKRLESQLAIYEAGGFYKKHMDQHHTKHRQITSICYLNDCPFGGELVIYNQNDRNKVDRLIRPLKGSFVIFLSKDIFHEVLVTNSIRYGLTTWMRDDEIPILF